LLLGCFAGFRAWDPDYYNYQQIYKDIGNDVLIPYLKRQHIYNLDYLIVSHNDFDHNGGVDSILYNFKVDNYLVGNSFEEINIDNLKIKNLNKYNYNSDENDGSSVLYFKFSDMNFLLMGDCSTSIEKQIMLNIINNLTTKKFNAFALNFFIK
jgi:competence protein ComEC